MSLVLKSVADLSKQATPCLIIPVGEGGKLSAAGKTIDKADNKAISKLLKRGDISGKVGESLLLPTTSIKAERILLLGAGAGKALKRDDLNKLLATLCAQIKSHKIKQALFAAESLEAEQGSFIEELAKRIGLASYHYGQTLSDKSSPWPLKKLTVASANNKANKNAAAQGEAIAEGMNLSRERGDLPGNICTPSHLASRARQLLRGQSRFKVSVLEEKKLRELGMGALLSVTAGTAQPAKLIVMEYKGAAKSQAPHVLVGKGVTFDSGGISLKPGARMDEMKYDMCGAASVLGTFATLKALQPKVNVVGIIGAVENMPAGNATKPGDVVTSMSGKTIEILNTDAEGRLVLCDALSYAARFKPASVIDIATLTGACVVALGKHATGLYSNDDDFAAELIDAGQRAGDRAWHMPMWSEYHAQLKSNFADLANVGGPEGGSITAACFLSQFCEDYRWAHLDIAGTAWVSGGNKGATGRPVALLSQYLLDRVQ